MVQLQRGPRGREKEWTDCVAAEDCRVVGITEDWSTAAFYLRVPCDSLCPAYPCVAFFFAADPLQRCHPLKALPQHDGAPRILLYPSRVFCCCVYRISKCYSKMDELPRANVSRTRARLTLRMPCAMLICGLGGLEKPALVAAGDKEASSCTD